MPQLFHSCIHEIGYRGGIILVSHSVTSHSGDKIMHWDVRSCGIDLFMLQVSLDGGIYGEAKFSHSGDREAESVMW